MSNFEKLKNQISLDKSQFVTLSFDGDKFLSNILEKNDNIKVCIQGTRNILIY